MRGRSRGGTRETRRPRLDSQKLFPQSGQATEDREEHAWARRPGEGLLWLLLSLQTSKVAANPRVQGTHSSPDDSGF